MISLLTYFHSFYYHAEVAEVASSNFNDLYPLSVLPFSVEPNPHFGAQKRALWCIGTPSTA